MIWTVCNEEDDAGKIDCSALCRKPQPQTVLTQTEFEFPYGALEFKYNDLGTGDVALIQFGLRARDTLVRFKPKRRSWSRWHGGAEPYISQSGRRGFKVTFHWRGKTSALAQLTFLLDLNYITRDTFYFSHRYRRIVIQYQQWVVGSKMILGRGARPA